MTIWLAALCSLGILGAIVIPFALSARFIKWAVENEHMVFLWLVALIVCWIMLTICFYVEGGAV